MLAQSSCARAQSVLQGRVALFAWEESASELLYLGVCHPQALALSINVRTSCCTHPSRQRKLTMLQARQQVLDLPAQHLVLCFQAAVAYLVEPEQCQPRDEPAVRSKMSWRAGSTAHQRMVMAHARRVRGSCSITTSHCLTQTRPSLVAF